MALTDETLAAKAADQAKLLGQWQTRALALIDGKLADAEAHAQTALTKALRVTPDGRRTDLRLRQSRSFQAALARIDELQATLAGPSTDALSGLLLDARAAFYRDALSRWWDLLPGHILKPGVTTPTQANLLRVRRVILHGMPLRLEIGVPIGRAQRSLQAALNLVAAHGTSRRAGADALETWARQAKEGISAVVGRALSDALTLADRIAGRDCCDPELVEPDPTLPE